VTDHIVLRLYPKGHYNTLKGIITMSFCKYNLNKKHSSQWQTLACPCIIWTIKHINLYRLNLCHCYSYWSRNTFFLPYIKFDIIKLTRKRESKKNPRIERIITKIEKLLKLKTMGQSFKLFFKNLRRLCSYLQKRIDF